MKYFNFDVFGIVSKKLPLIREFFFPSRCPLCDAPLESETEADAGICSACAQKFPIEDVPRCATCGKPLISEIGICLSCRKMETNVLDGMMVLYPYSGEAQKLIAAYKFGKAQRPHRSLAVFFAEKMLEGITQFKGLPNDSFCYVPVPPRPGKIKKTGWDQIETIAGILQKRKKLPVERCLKRLPSKSQKELNREGRQNNLRGKILCVKPPPKTALLFDDVYTTGSTMQVCAETLKAAGAERVYGLCLYFD